MHPERFSLPAVREGKRLLVGRVDDYCLNQTSPGRREERKDLLKSASGEACSILNDEFHEGLVAARFLVFVPVG